MISETIQQNGIQQEIEVRQIGIKGQDHAAHGNYTKDGITTYWSVIFDGHGSNETIHIIRSADMNTIMQENDPHLTLQKIIEEKDRSRTASGSTMVYAKLHHYQTYRELEIVNIGDSQAVLFINGKWIFMTEPHTCNNGKEIARLIKDMCVPTRVPFVFRKTDIEVLSPTTLMIKKGKYINFNNGEQLAPTQALGHKGITGLEPEVTLFRLKPTDTFQVFLYSDGVGDMLPVHGPAVIHSISFMTTAGSALAMVEEAERRWEQEWLICSEENRMNFYVDSFGSNGYDDCACAIMKSIPMDLSIDPMGPMGLLGLTDPINPMGLLGLTDPITPMGLLGLTDPIPPIPSIIE